MVKCILTAMLLVMLSTGFSVEAAVTNNPNGACETAYYIEAPNAVAADDTHRYYEYYWQNTENLCINIYDEPPLGALWKQRVIDILSFAEQRLGLIVPVNAFVVDQENASAATLAGVARTVCDLFSVLDYDDVQTCYDGYEGWGMRSAAAGVGVSSIPNGGDLFFFANNWNEFEALDVPTKVLFHEFFHIHQNSMKFYFEDSRRFGIPKRWQDDPENSLYSRAGFVPVFPNWIEEGGAEFAGIVLAAAFDDNIVASELFIEALDEARAVISTAAENDDVVSLKDYESNGGLFESSDNPNNGIARNFAYQYTGGAIAFAYLWSLNDNNFEKILVDYYQAYAESDVQNPGFGWKDSFEATFNVTLADFYVDFDAFMRLDRSTQIAILKTTAEIKQAFPIKLAGDFDADGDGLANSIDLDDDADGVSDEQEALDGTNPLNRFSCKSGCFSFDVDESLQAQPLTDGLLVIRHLFGFSGDSLTSGAVSGEANRDDPDSIAGYLTDADSQLDIDGDGESKPLTDGLLLIRYLFGFSGDSLISGAIGNGAERDTAEEVEAYIKKRIPVQ